MENFASLVLLAFFLPLLSLAACSKSKAEGRKGGGSKSSIRHNGTADKTTLTHKSESRNNCIPVKKPIVSSPTPKPPTTSEPTEQLFTPIEGKTPLNEPKTAHDISGSFGRHLAQNANRDRSEPPKADDDRSAHAGNMDFGPEPDISVNEGGPPSLVIDPSQWSVTLSTQDESETQHKTKKSKKK